MRLVDGSLRTSKHLSYCATTPHEVGLAAMIAGTYPPNNDKELGVWECQVPYRYRYDMIDYAADSKFESR